MFYGGEEFPYNLSAESPCIDAGTMDFPAFIQLPDKDLAGNPRIYNGYVDMGAYEWNPTVGITKPSVGEEERMLLRAAPNPFRYQINITAIVEKKAFVEITVYSGAGLLVKTLFRGTTLPGKSVINWSGKDNNGNILPKGIYFVIMTTDGKESGQVRILKQ